MLTRRQQTLSNAEKGFPTAGLNLHIRPNWLFALAETTDLEQPNVEGCPKTNSGNSEIEGLREIVAQTEEVLSNKDSDLNGKFASDCSFSRQAEIQ